MINFIRTICLIVFFQIISVTCLAKNHIEISGVEGKIKQNIVIYLDSDDLECSASEAIKNAFVAAIPKKVAKATRPFGYYKPQIEIKNKIKADPDKNNCLSINVNVELGQAIIIRGLDLLILDHGNPNKIFENTIKNSGLIKGGILAQSDYEDLKLALVEQASEMGYLDAKYTKNQIDIFPENFVADISLHLDTGSQYQVEQIEIHQTPEFLDQRFIENMIALKANEYFSKSELYEIRKKLVSTGYFDQVSVNIDYSKRHDNKVPITIVVTPSDRIRYSAGVGFSTDTGARVSVDYKHLRLSDFGYQFNSKLSLSEVISEFSTGIKIPSKSRALNKWSNFDVGYRVERSDNVSSDTSKLGFSQTRIHENKWQNINYIDLVNERFDTGDNHNESTLLVPGTSWSYINTDNPVLPKHGFKIGAELKGASHNILSDSSFLQLGVNFKAVTSVGEHQRFIVRTELGTTYTNNLEGLPSSYRFFAGGDKSIRGFSYQELGPVNSQGDVIGAKHLAVASLEYEYRIAGAWAGAVFTDVGNAFNSAFKLEKSVGVGVRWFSPIGPVRFDLGFPINDERDFKIHITLGPDL